MSKHSEKNDFPNELDPQVEADVEREQTDSLTEEEETAGTPLGDHRSFFDNDIPVGDEPLR